VQQLSLHLLYVYMWVSVVEAMNDYEKVHHMEYLCQNAMNIHKLCTMRSSFIVITCMCKQNCL